MDTHHGLFEFWCFCFALSEPGPVSLIVHKLPYGKLIRVQSILGSHDRTPNGCYGCVSSVCFDRLL